MTIGAGKLDDWCTTIREATGAEGVIIITHGRTQEARGFSAQLTLPAQLALPDILEEIARQIRADLAAGGLTAL
jgi:hypothetical protein